jgi:putative colanic acid biosynthesis acetyltransferase WcaF
MTLIKNRHNRSDPSFTFRNRFIRIIWRLVYFYFVRFTPVYFRKWRLLVYTIFGAELEKTSNIYPKAKVWAPWNLKMESHTCIANDVFIYNQAKVTIKEYALISQGAHICSSSHDFNSQKFTLIIKPIVIGRHAWIASEAFVGPGVNIGEGAILSARGVAFRNLSNWGIYMGNPANQIKERKLPSDWK